MVTHGAPHRPPLFQGYDPRALDRALLEALRREGAEWAEEDVSEFGRRTASAEAIAWGFQANQNPPRLQTHDRFGNRIHEVEFHPAWHELIRLPLPDAIHPAPL